MLDLSTGEMTSILMSFSAPSITDRIVQEGVDGLAARAAPNTRRLCGGEVKGPKSWMDTCYPACLSTLLNENIFRPQASRVRGVGSRGRRPGVLVGRRQEKHGTLAVTI